MAIDRKTVDHIAKLSRLKLTEDQVEKITGELGAILAYIDQLNEVDTEGVEPMICAPRGSGAGDKEIFGAAGLRPDAAATSLDHDQVLQNAPDRDEAHFLVPPPLKSEEE